MVKEPMIATSSGLAPTRGADISAACSAKDCHCVKGDFSRFVKWPFTPIDAQVFSCASRYSLVAFGCKPSEFPQK